MADIYFKYVKTVAGPYLKAVGVRNVRPEERGGLNLDLQEYFTFSGDIGSSTFTVNDSLKAIRQSLQKDGHALHFDPPDAEERIQRELDRELRRLRAPARAQAAKAVTRRKARLKRKADQLLPDPRKAN